MAIHLRRRPNPTPVPPPPAPATLTVRVFDATTHKAIKDAHIFAVGVFDAQSDDFGRQFFRINVPSRFGTQVIAKGYQPIQIDTPISNPPLPGQLDLTVNLIEDTTSVAKGTEVMRLMANGPDVLTVDGVRWFGTGITAFDMLEFVARGDLKRASDYIRWGNMRRPRPIQIYRVFGMYNAGTGQGLGRFIPQEYGLDHYFDAMETLFKLAQQEQVRIDLGMFADMQVDEYRPDNPLAQLDQQYMFDRAAHVASKYPNVMLNGGNQFPKNGFDPMKLHRPNGVFASRGSGLEDQLPIPEGFDYYEYHPGRDGFVRKAKAAFELRTGDTNERIAITGPQFWTEPIGIATYANGSTTNDPWRMWQFAIQCRMFGVKALYGHLRSGILVQLPATGDLAEQCVEAMIDGFMSYPELVEFQYGSYSRGYENGSPDLPIDHRDEWATRTYCMSVGNRAAVSVSEPTALWPGPRPQNGYRIIKSFRYLGLRLDGTEAPNTVFIMER